MLKIIKIKLWNHVHPKFLLFDLIVLIIIIQCDQLIISPLLTLQMKGQRATSCGGCPLACTVQRLVQSGMEWGVSSGWLEKPMMWGRLWSVMWKCPQCQHLNAKIRKSKGKGHNSRSNDRSTCTIVLKLYVIYRNVCFWLNPSFCWKKMQFFFFKVPLLYNLFYRQVMLHLYNPLLLKGQLLICNYADF